MQMDVSASIDEADCAVLDGPRIGHIERARHDDQARMSSEIWKARSSD